MKNKIVLISNELDLVSKENISLKNDFFSHSCHDSIVIPVCNKNACSTCSSIIENDICMLKKSVDFLGLTLSQCAMSHKRLEFMFRKKHAPHLHAHHHGIHVFLMFTHMIPWMLERTLIHIPATKTTLQNFIMID